MKRAYCILILSLLLFVAKASAQQDAPPGGEKAQNQLSEIEAYRKAAQNKEPAERVAALKKFLSDFPEARLKPIALMQLFRSMVDSGTSDKEYVPIAHEAMLLFPNGPQRPFALNDVAYILAEQGKGLENALKYAQEALEHTEPNNEELYPAIQDTLGWVYFKLGNYEAALKLIEASSKATEDPDVYEHLGQVYDKAGQPAPAIDALIKAVAISSNESAKQRRMSALKALYVKKNGSEEGLEKLIAEKKQVLINEKALVNRRFEAPAPDWALKNLKGATVKFDDLRGKVVVLDWWGSWCPPCRLELPHFQKLYETYKDSNDVIFVGMNWEQAESGEERIKAAKNFLEEKKYTFPVALDHEMEVGAKFNVDSFPTVFVIDRTGNIRYRTIGYTPDTFEILEAQIKAELAREK